MSIKRIIDCIKTHNTFLITSHQNLEGDALGSEIAFSNLLKKLGKSVIILNQDRTPGEYSWLSGSRLIRQYQDNMKLRFEVLVMLDCSNKSRCGSVISLARPGQPIINIDHHISNDRFADINWVSPGASSVSEMVYQLYKKMHIKIDVDTAKALYVGILTDTGSFRYTNTTSLTHQIAAQLLKFNFDASKIYQNIYESIPSCDILLLLSLLSTLERHVSGKVIMFNTKQKQLKKTKAHIDLTEHVLSFGRSIRGAKVCVLFKRQQGKKGQIRVNLRSRGSQVDVNRVARFFGGGGHRTASGCTVKGSLTDVKRKILKKIKEQL
jgi:phosphoesterase RecJ-like protein